MPPIAVNRRRFLGCSAAASLALSQGALAEADAVAADAKLVRLGLIGIGNRGTALLRALLELPAVQVVGICDPEPKHRMRGQGIVEKIQGRRPDGVEDPRPCSIDQTSTRWSRPCRAISMSRSGLKRFAPANIFTPRNRWP